MRVRNFELQLWLPQTRDKVFAFFSDAQNLDLITPPWLHFRTITLGPPEMQPGHGARASPAHSWIPVALAQ